MELAAFLTAPADTLTYLDYVAAERAAARKPGAGAPLRLALLRNVTVETMLPVISGELLRAGFAPEMWLGNFDTIAADTMAEDAALYDFLPDFIVLHQWLETISPSLASRFTSLSAGDVEGEISRTIALTEAVLRSIRGRTNAPVILNNFPLTGRPTLGILDAQQPDGQTRAILELNARLLEMVSSIADAYIIDFMRIASDMGSQQFFDAKQWQIARLPFGRSAQMEIGRELVRFVRALRGRTKKCLVLDCDNTLWGGVIGEDGIDGIALGSTYPGSCFVDFQREILNLHDRGVILAICSKNDEDEVLTVLREHPDMLIREAHLATWAINWDDKPGNLRRIAAELNIGIDSLVFIDDSAFEVEFVRQQLPEVTALLLPKDRALFRDALAKTGLFDSLTLTAEDRTRTASYKANVQRAQVQASTTNLAEYLGSLDIVMRFGPPSELEVARVSQLSQKTNQFNLTTRRYTEAEIRALKGAPDARVYTMKAGDRVADLGLVGVMVVRFAGSRAEIESCFISCRALGRSLEDAFLAAVANDVFSAGASELIGRFIPTAKNSLCKDYYKMCGLTQIEERDGSSSWKLEVGLEPVGYPAWVTVEFAGAEMTSR